MAADSWDDLDDALQMAELRKYKPFHVEDVIRNLNWFFARQIKTTFYLPSSILEDSANYFIENRPDVRATGILLDKVDWDTAESMLGLYLDNIEIRGWYSLFAPLMKLMNGLWDASDKTNRRLGDCLIKSVFLAPIPYLTQLKKTDPEFYRVIFDSPDSHQKYVLSILWGKSYATCADDQFAKVADDICNRMDSTLVVPSH